MNRSITQALQDVDVILVVVEAGRISREDRQVFGLLPAGRPAVLAINKIDRLADKKLLLPLLAQLQAERAFSDIVPASAKSGEQTPQLLQALRAHLPQQQAIYTEGEITDRGERFLAAELVREKLFRRLGDELPYGASTVIEKFETEGKLRRIHVAIVVDKAGHKAMVIGKRGEKLKLIGTDARRDMEKLFGGKVFLQIWVKVKHGWADDERTLKTPRIRAVNARARHDNQPGYVLHTYPYRETSLVVETFTRAHGRVAMVARGAKRPRSALRGSIMAFQPLG